MRVRLWHPINIRDAGLANYPLSVIAKSHICGISYPSTYRLSGGKHSRNALMRTMRVAPTTVVEIGDYIDGLQSYLHVRLANEEDALDITQEACLRMLLEHQKDKAIHNPQAYLFQIARHLLYRHYTRRERQPVFSDIDVDLIQSSDDGIEDLTLNIIRRQQVNAVVSELPPKCQCVLVLRWREGLRVAEIASRMNLSRAMVKKYLTKGLAHFRKRLRRYVLVDQQVR